VTVGAPLSDAGTRLRRFAANARARAVDPRLRGFVAVRTLPVLYVNMPKSGCTTIKNLLHRLETGAFLDDPLTIHDRKDLFVRPEREPEEVARRIRHDPVFTFVRHPLRRAYSCFNEKIHFRGKYAFGRVRGCVAKDYGARFDAEPTLERHRENFKCFLRFATDSFQSRNGWRRDPHWCPQTMVLNQAQRSRTIDFVGRVERFDAHLRVALGLAGVVCDLEVPRLNEGPPPPWRYEEVLDDEVRALGRALYAADFERLGYDL
jgi:hypothetical protein